MRISTLVTNRSALSIDFMIRYKVSVARLIKLYAPWHDAGVKHCDRRPRPYGPGNRAGFSVFFCWVETSVSFLLRFKPGKVNKKYY